jgi:hypothetical protein
MNIRNVLKLPLFLATLGLTAGNYNNNQQGSDCAPLCYAGPVLDCDNNWDVLGAALYEQVNVQGADIAALIDRTTPLYPANGSIVNQTETPSWGFRVGLGYKNWTDNWRSYATYSWFKAISNLNYQAAVGQQYVPSAYTNQFVENTQIPQSFGFANLQTGNYTLVNNLNVLMGRPTLITENLELTTSYGVTGSWLTRRQIAVYTNETTTTTPVSFTPAQGGYFQNYQKYLWWGIGPMVALHSVYYFGGGIGMYADANVAVTYGVSDCRTATFSKQQTAAAGSPPVYRAQEAVQQNKIFQFSPQYYFQLGLNWSQTFREDSIRASFNIGYETTYYMQVMKTITPEIAYRSENGAGLGMQGLVLQGMLDF